MKRGVRHGVSELNDRLCIGSELVIRLGADRLRSKYGITHFLSCNGSNPKLPDFETKVLDIEDEEDEDIMQHFEEANKFIENASGRVFIYCTAGRSRSATILTAYLMKNRSLSVEQALDVIREVRDVLPNPGFMKQLKAYEETLNCELCRLEKTTDWYYENPDFVVISCDSCDSPMVVLRKHTMEADPATNQLMQKALETVAAQHYAGKSWYVDKVQRTIYTHMHWHARQQRFKL